MDVPDLSPDPRSAIAGRSLALGTAALAGVAFAGASALTSFHVGLNDFWGNLFAAARLDVANPESLYNGFYPVGYPALLRTGGRHAVLFAAGVNVALAAAMVGAIAWLASRLAGPRAGVAAAALVALEPRLFSHAIAAGSDVPAMALLVLAVVLGCGMAVRAGPRAPAAALVLVGALIGLGGLFRYHVLAAGAAFIVGLAALHRPRWRTALSLGLGVLLTYVVQVAVSIGTGRGPLETAQGFNVYRMVFGIDWFNVRPDMAPRSVIDVIAAHPAAVAGAYLNALHAAVPYALAAAAAAFLTSGALARTGRILLAAMPLYGVIVSLGASSRAWLPYRPILLMLVVCLAASGVRTALAWRPAARWRAVLPSVALLLAAAVAGRWLIADARLIERRRTLHREYAAIERLLFEEEGVRDPAAVFTTDFDLYFPGVFPHAPFRNGGWMRYDLHAYESAFPAVCVQTLACFYGDCLNRSISHVVLTPAASRLSETVGGVYDGTAGVDEFLPIGQQGSFRVYRVQR